MKNLLLLIIPLGLFLMSCGQPRQNDENKIKDPSELVFDVSDKEQAFLNNLATLCGKSFYGREVYVQPGRESWANKILLMKVEQCQDTHIYIPFQIADDQSRTWMFLIEDGKLRLRHDHRHEDGSPADTTLYGGFSDGSGDAFKQYFPADEFTKNLLQDTLNRQWNIILSENMDKLSYQLQYNGEIVFVADFDLTAPI